MPYEEEDDGDDSEDNEEESWKAKQHQWMESKFQIENDGDSDNNEYGYQLLTCRATNNLYTNFRW